jgi:hypothetical protein
LTTSPIYLLCFLFRNPLFSLQIEMPKIQPEWYGPGQVHLDVEDRLICVAPDGGLIYWRSGDLPDLETLSNNAMHDPAGAPKILPGSWDTLPAPKLRSVQLSEHCSWGVGVDGSLYHRPARRLLAREDWNNVKPPSAEMTKLMEDGGNRKDAPCPSMLLGEYFALGQTRIHVSRALRKCHDLAERKPKTVVPGSVGGNGALQAGGSLGGSTSVVPSVAASTQASAPVSGTVSPRVASPVFLGASEQKYHDSANVRSRRSASIASEMSLTAGEAEDESLPELTSTPSNLEAYAHHISVNTDNSYVLCIDKAGQIWGRLGMAPSVPEGRFWIR